MTIPNSSSDGLILLAHGTPNVLGEMDTYMKFVTGGRAVPPELVHELQERYAQIGLGDEPADDCKLTAKLVASELEDIVSERDYHFSFQSQGMSGGSWLGPTVEDTLVDLKHHGYDTVVIQPIGFLCDHVEILYDIDIAFQETVGRLDVTLIRAESLNASPLLIDALEDLALHGGRPKYALAGWHRLRKRWSSMFHPPSSSHASQSHRASELSARTWCYEHSSHRN